MNFIDKRIVDKLLTDAIAAGYFVSVNDGGEWVVRKSRDKAQIVSALESADRDTLAFRTLDRYVGQVLLVHGNEPGVILADHSDNPEINALVAPAMALADKLGA